MTPDFWNIRKRRHSPPNDDLLHEVRRLREDINLLLRHQRVIREETGRIGSTK